MTRATAISAPRKANAAVCLAAAGLVPVPLRLADMLSSGELAHLGAVAMVVAGVLYGGRVVVHACMGYWQHIPKRDWPWTERQRRALSALLLVDGALAVVLVGAGMWCLSDDPSTWLRIGVSTVLAVLVAASSHNTLKLARNVGLRRGTEAVGMCAVVVWMRENASLWRSFPGVANFDHVCWEMRTSVSQVSGLVMVIVIGLSVMPVAEGITAGRDTIQGEAPQTTSRTIKPATTTSPTPLRRARAAPTEPAPAAQDHVALPKTYGDLCADAPVPALGAPDDQQTELEQVWRGIGAILAGCGGRAKVVPGTNDVFYVTGRCEGKAFPSVAVTSPTHPAAMLLEGWAIFARDLIRAGRLRGASSHQVVGRGDFQILYARAGGYVLIRRNVSDGKGGYTRSPASCADLEPATQTPVRVPPGLADLWLRYAERFQQPTWPMRVRSRDLPGRRFFEFRSADGHNAKIAVGWCAGGSACEFRASTIRWRTGDPGALPVTADRVLSFGPR